MADFVRVAGADEIGAGSSKIVDVNGNSVAVWNLNGNYYAFQNVCPHRGGPVGEGEVEGNIITCPWHGFRFNVMTGACEHNAAMKISTYEVQVEGNDIKIGV